VKMSGKPVAPPRGMRVWRRGGLPGVRLRGQGSAGWCFEGSGRIVFWGGWGEGGGRGLYLRLKEIERGFWLPGIESEENTGKSSKIAR